MLIVVFQAQSVIIFLGSVSFSLVVLSLLSLSIQETAWHKFILNVS